ncbi:hypothetical protein SR1949_54260 [Sphaerospermopsis reniformis]|uniref:Uncharacterized protein n=1 Tax=Sphaerospermopsis reniformis TaxID=531300 RepID=A0A480A5F4_9CYAN|nr:hypothetical protein SR1949_54260 [Sphaerospermopsis reniformis]
MKPEISSILAGFNWSVTNILRHSSLTRTLSSGAKSIFAINAAATGLGWFKKLRQLRLFS